jgi:hypothetical protein
VTRPCPIFLLKGFQSIKQNPYELGLDYSKRFDKLSTKMNVSQTMVTKFIDGLSFPIQKETMFMSLVDLKEAFFMVL